jgi:hypothetical protein
MSTGEMSLSAQLQRLERRVSDLSKLVETLRLDHERLLFWMADQSDGVVHSNVACPSQKRAPHMWNERCSG